MTATSGILAVLAASLVIISLRAFPFVVMSRYKGDAAWLRLVEKYLSPVVIALLVVYSYSTLEWRTSLPYIAGLVTVVMQIVWRNGLASIFAGTLLYMILVRL